MKTRSVVAILLGVTALFVFVGAAVFLFGGDDRRIGALKGPSYVAGHFALYTDTPGSEQNLGFIKSFSGCGIRANVAGAGPGADNVIRKHISNIAYEPCVLRFGLTTMDPAVFSWVGDALSHKTNRRGFWLISTDFNYKVLSGTHIVDAAIQKVAFPELDAGSKDPGYITLTMRPDSITEFETCCGSFTPSNVKGVLKPQKFSSNFRLTLGNGTDATKVNKIGPWEFRNEETASAGEEKVPQTASELHLGDLQVTTAQSKNATWRTWFDDFVIKGNSGQANETTAKIEFLATNTKDVLGTLSFSGVGIVGYEGAGGESNKDTIAQETYTLYVEEASFTLGSPAAQPAPPPPTTTTTTTETTTAPPPPPPPPAETTPEERKLAGPEGLKAAALGEGEVELSWTPVEGAEYYVILASTEPGGEHNELATAKEASLVIADLRPGVYYFVVRAVIGETESENSPEAEVKVG